MTVEQRLDSIDAKLEQLVIASAQLLETTRAHTRQIELQTHQLELQTEQIGRLTEGLIEIKLIGEKQEQNISRLLDVTERQSRIIERLIPGSDLES